MTGTDIKKFYITYLKPNGLMEVLILFTLLAACLGTIILLVYIYATAT